MNHEPKPDDRQDNVEKIQHNIDMTLYNTELANEMLSKTSDEKAKNDLIEKNKRREEALKGMNHELKDEADHANSIE